MGLINNELASKKKKRIERIRELFSFLLFVGQFDFFLLSVLRSQRVPGRAALTNATGSGAARAASRCEYLQHASPVSCPPGHFCFVADSRTRAENVLSLGTP